MGYSQSTHAGYSTAGAVARAVSYHQPWTHFLLWVDLACILPIVLRMWYVPPPDWEYSLGTTGYPHGVL